MLRFRAMEVHDLPHDLAEIERLGVERQDAPLESAHV